jgi:hypothetical protein
MCLSLLEDHAKRPSVVSTTALTCFTSWLAAWGFHDPTVQILATALVAQDKVDTMAVQATGDTIITAFPATTNMVSMLHVTVVRAARGSSREETLDHAEDDHEIEDSM